MELTKQDTQKAKGIAIIGMVMLHLFCRLGDLPYTASIYIGKIPLIYYLGLFGDICVPIYCFCSGYAHFLINEKDKERYIKKIPHKILHFLLHFWIVLVIFSVIGLVSGNGSEIPGSLGRFLGNFFLYGLSYNGAWWFVLTYILLLLMSPLLIALARKMNGVLLIFLSGAIYVVAYYFRFQNTPDISNDVIAWIYQQLVLIGTSQFPYVVGLICRKERWVTKLRLCLSKEDNTAKMSIGGGLLRMLLFVLPLMALLGHSVVQTVFVAPFTAATVLPVLFAFDLPKFADRILLFLGEHSMNVWLIHMFFYLTLFEDLVFCAEYPILILLLMFAICIGISFIIQWIDRWIAKGLKII